MKMLTLWKVDGDLAGVRDAEALAKLPSPNAVPGGRSGPKSTP